MNFFARFRFLSDWLTTQLLPIHLTNMDERETLASINNCMEVLVPEKFCKREIRIYSALWFVRLINMPLYETFI